MWARRLLTGQLRLVDHFTRCWHRWIVQVEIMEDRASTTSAWRLSSIAETLGRTYRFGKHTWWTSKGTFCKRKRSRKGILTRGFLVLQSCIDSSCRLQRCTRTSRIWWRTLPSYRVQIAMMWHCVICVIRRLWGWKGVEIWCHLGCYILDRFRRNEATSEAISPDARHRNRWSILYPIIFLENLAWIGEVEV